MLYDIQNIQLLSSNFNISDISVKKVILFYNYKYLILVYIWINLTN